MSGKPIQYLRHVQPDISEAVEWYNAQKSNLGEEFLAEIRVYIEKISEWPGSFAIVQNDPVARHAVLKRFPFVIYFMEKETHITIIAIVHGKRSSRQWQQYAR